jgi:hypothetical protein
MGICWSCYWGWPKAIADIYDKACKDLGDDDGHVLHYGPGHVVWEDENWHSAEWCLENFDKYSEDLNESEKTIVRRSLQELAAIPLEERDLEPEDYDDEHPELYPPPKGAIMVHR